MTQSYSVAALWAFTYSDPSLSCHYLMNLCQLCGCCAHCFPMAFFECLRPCFKLDRVHFQYFSCFCRDLGLCFGCFGLDFCFMIVDLALIAASVLFNFQSRYCFLLVLLAGFGRVRMLLLSWDVLKGCSFWLLDLLVGFYLAWVCGYLYQRSFYSRMPWLKSFGLAEVVASFFWDFSYSISVSDMANTHLYSTGFYYSVRYSSSTPFRYHNSALTYSVEWSRHHGGTLTSLTGLPILLIQIERWHPAVMGYHFQPLSDHSEDRTFQHRMK